jgi:hypothetical protein
VAYDAPLDPAAGELAAGGADGPRALAYRGVDAERVGALFDRLGFKGIRERVAALEPRE